MKGYDVIVLAGQSNAEGYGVGEVSEEYVPSDSVLMIGDKASPRFEKAADGTEFLALEFPSEITISVADEPVGGEGKVGKLALFFFKNYVEKGLLAPDRKILLVNAAVGGTGFARKEWGVGNILYRRLVALTDYALGYGDGRNEIVALLWHQGECDSVCNPDFTPETRYETYKRNLTAQLEDFKTRYADAINGNLPFIAGGFCSEWYLKNKIPCDAVLRGLREVADEQNGAFVETSDLPSNNQKTANGDDIHFCRESLHILGARYFDAYNVIKNR